MYKQTLWKHLLCLLYTNFNHLHMKFITSIDKENSSIHSPHHVEDAALKTLAQFFGEELLPYFQIEGEVDHIGPTETVHLEVKKFYQDFNLVMKDGSWTHFEFQSSNQKALENLKRFWAYEALTTYQHNVVVRTYVLFSGNIKHPITEFTSGFNTYRVHPIIMKGHRCEEVFENIQHKLDNTIPLTREDLVPLTLCPLMGGDLPQKDRIQKAIRIVHNTEHIVPNADKIEAVIYAMASKFLEKTELNQIKEEIKMTELGAIIYNDGIADGITQGIEQGIEQEATENATNLFKNGISYEIVRKSIHSLSDEVLQKIYDEVMSSQNT